MGVLEADIQVSWKLGSLLTWALRGSQERRCVRARLDGAPALSIYLKQKEKTEFQTVKFRGLISQPLQALLRCTVTPFSLKLYGKWVKLF